MPEAPNDKRTAALEAALLEYIVRYGATEFAREAFKNPDLSAADEEAFPKPLELHQAGP